MWASFIDFLESLIRDLGLVKIMGGLVAAGAILAGLGVVFTQASVVPSAGITVVALLLLCCLLQAADRRRLYKRLGDGAFVLDRYSAELHSRQTPESFNISEWHEEELVKSNGDAIISRYLTLEVGESPLQTLWCLGYVEKNDRDFRYQAKTHIRAFEFDEDKKIGVEIPTTSSWSDHKVTTFVHFKYDKPPGEIVRVMLRLKWPKYRHNLICKGLTEQCEWKFRRQADQLCYRLHIDGKAMRSRQAVITPHRSTPHPVHTSNGHLELTLSSPTRDKLVGFSIQLSDSQ